MPPTFIDPVHTYNQGSHTLPGRYYTSSTIFGEELERIFYDRWLCIGRVAQLPQPGDYFLQEIGKESLIILRGRDGILRAFYNVCRHRGTRLCEQARGQFSETIQCSYHAWTYALDGRLIGAPFMQEVAGFDKNNFPLK